MFLHKLSVLAAGLLLALANVAVAGWVDHGSSCIVASSGDQWILTADGQMYGIGSGSWIQENSTPLPVPVANIKFWEYGRWIYIVDSNDNVWTLGGGGIGSWTNLGPPPDCTPIAVQPSTWTNVKTLYR